MKSALKGLAWRAGLVVTSLVVTFAVIEIIARAAETDAVEAFFTPFEHDDSGYRTDRKDPELLYTLAWYVPGATGTTGTAPVRINNLGLRDDRDYPKTKPAQCFRVLGIGDSMTFGKGVAESETYLGVLETRLKARFPGRCIEVLNAGMPNTNFFIQWVHLEREWHRLKPDLVLWGLFVYNDTQLQSDAEPYSQSWMEFVDRNSWLKRSALVRWAYHRAFFDLGATAMANDLPRFYDDEYAGWAQFCETADKLKKYAAEQKFQVAFALIPIPESYNDYPYHGYHERLKSVLEGMHGFGVFDLIDAVRGLNARKHWVHPSDGHPDAFVHGQMAEHLDLVMPWSQWMNAP